MVNIIIVFLKVVLYNPHLRRNVLSGVEREKLGINFADKNGKVFVYYKHDNELFYALRKNDLYFLRSSKYVTKWKGNNKSVKFSANQMEKVNVNELWHERFCHINSE